MSKKVAWAGAPFLASTLKLVMLETNSPASKVAIKEWVSVATEIIMTRRKFLSVLDGPDGAKLDIRIQVLEIVDVVLDQDFDG